MRLTRLYIDIPLQEGTTIELDERTRHHCGVVLRAKAGDTVFLFNGDGNDYQATLSTVSKKSITAEIEAVIPRETESNLSIHLGQCLSSSQRFDLAVQKATEMGVCTITPLHSERSQKLASKQYAKKLAHWQSIAIHACEQSHRGVIPEILEPLHPYEWMKAQQSDKKWFCSISEQGLNTENDSVSSLSILVGPEGGLTEEEEHYAKTYDFQAVQLGKRILRTETAPIAAISLAQYFWGDIN